MKYKLTKKKVKNINADAKKAKKFDKQKLRLDLISIPALLGVATACTHGATKYGDRNWEKGFSYNRVYGALLRHLTAFMFGEDIDRDSGLNTIDQVVWNAMVLSHFQKTKTGIDDRIKFDKTDVVKNILEYFDKDFSYNKKDRS